MAKLLVGTQSQGKQREYRDLLHDLPVEWLGLAEVGLGDMDVDENGDTFEANARIKALAYAEASGLPTLADDSGLVVDALDGAPGVFSARYAGPGTTDEDRYRKLLREMAAVPVERRSARFVCVVALALPDGRVYMERGQCEGSIAFAPHGQHGFGYDPVFLLPDGRHLAELTAAEKDAISHRGVALAVFKPKLFEVLTAFIEADNG